MSDPSQSSSPSPSSSPARTPLRILAREPLVYFALGGGLIFLVYQLSGGPQAPGVVETDAASEPDREITVGAGELETLVASFRQAWKRDPTSAEKADLIETFLREEILHREGQSLELGKDDPLVRRRVIEKMTLLARPPASESEPSEQALRRWFTLYRHRFFRPERIWFEQVFFDPKRRADAEAAARGALSGLAGQAAPAGDPFVLPAKLEEKTRAEVAHLFGDGFAEGLFAARPGAWSGPLSSQFGMHLVRPLRREPEGSPDFEEARAHVRADWLTAETRGQRAAADTLLSRYRVHIADSVPEAVRAQPLLAPFSRAPGGTRPAARGEAQK